MTNPPAAHAEIGQHIEPVVLRTDPVRLLRFGAATHNAHRIHYDPGYATTEGLDAPVVMAQLHGALFHRAAAEFCGGPRGVVSVEWRNRAPAYVGCELVVTGVVRAIADGLVTLALEEHTGDGVLCAAGEAVVVGDANPVC
ncbi:3-methylfumaryl-CoA hydratase [Nocardia transvalensis]|uniref:3-methylfumaryl-CoA hydratase n=1 Tax=Nocardia transvalensis TaxID=37333 RepID=A0A7W9PHA3_9NOCA|nr:acyl dehydratase [Nocardia transvalensis]MBB5916132.1 3-methylfumaryl-CoA hydratase [Nocardia transvalensis]